MSCVRPGIVAVRVCVLLPPPVVPPDDDPAAAKLVDGEETEDAWPVEPVIAPANDAAVVVVEVVFVEVVVMGATARGATELVGLMRFVVCEFVVLVVEPSEVLLVVLGCLPEVTGDTSLSVAVGC